MVQLPTVLSCVLSAFALLCLCLSCNASPAPTLTERDAQSTACGEIVNSGDDVFYASLVYECLTSVPFNPAVATRFIDYYNDTLKFQSTLSYLKTPPASYQQPSTDLIAGLGAIQTRIDNDGFSNQYEFEAALQTLLYSAHDAHVDLFAGVLAAFSFGSNYSIASVSLDGVQLPKVYFSDDIYDSQNPNAGYQASAISTIDGENAIEYLKKFGAKNSVGSLEPHSEFNQLMSSPAQAIQAFFNVWGGGATFYPGDTLSFVLENGTKIDTRWLAVYNNPGPTGPLETGGDFYNFFVLGFYPASYDPNATAATTSSAAASSTSVAAAATSTAAATAGWNLPGVYPDPDVAQADLGTYGGGWVSGYFLRDLKIAVLSIPSFVESGSAVNTFSYAVQQFLSQSKAAGMTKVVVDLQQNWGGDALLAFDTFKQFFPTIDPYGGSRLRAHPAVDAMGQAITGYWDELTPDYDDYYNLAADEFVASIRINADTMENFTSWNEFFGPHPANGDLFTTTQQYNLSSYIFDEEAVQDDDYWAVYGFAGQPANTSQPYAATDIIMLSDSLCSSSCALFMEMMRHDAGVRTVVAGGLPFDGPMQAPSLSRGAAEYDVVDVLDGNIAYAQYILQAEDEPYDFLPNRTEANDVFITYASINLRDQVRRGSDVPLQFVYEAADCRIWFTPQTFYNYTALWTYAAEAIWTNPKLCVANSTGYATTNSTDTKGPPASVLPSKAQATTQSYGSIIADMFSGSASLVETAISDGATYRDEFSFEGSKCPCPESYYCMEEYQTCVDGKIVLSSACVPTCNVYPGYCSNSGDCIPLDTTADVDTETTAQLKVTKGFCDPLPLRCSTRKGVAKVKPGKGAPLSIGRITRW